jgi:RNA polymerase sigma-70 factor (ECF subfamily)
MRDPQDGRAWAEFVEIYEPVVYRLARKEGLQDADARDLTQQVLIAVADRVERWDPDRSKGSFRAWLYRVARNLTVNLMVNRRRHPPGTGDTGVQRLLNEKPAPAGEESALFDAEYRRQVFRWAAEQVRGEFRDTTWDAFWRTCVEGCEMKRVAEQLDMSVGAVYIARSRVLARLREVVIRIERVA